jgi:alpha-galactosidase
MAWRRWICVVVLGLACVLGSQSSAERPSVAPTPPMGWNSWDAYGTTVNEAQVRANAGWMAKHLKSFGWTYVTVDMEWFVKNPTAQGGSKTNEFAMDGHGRYLPAENRFPSAAGGAGFRPLAEYVHGLGLKFGIHILQGVPKIAAAGDATMDGSTLGVADAADRSGTCVWNFDNYDVKDDAAGQAYYDSLLRMYAGWGVDLLKVDCIASRPYKGAEIAMIARAIAKTGRPIALSLSPGEAPMDKVPEMRSEAAMWRISDDVWDVWHSGVMYPQGLGDQIPRLERWSGQATPGHWPDADMLPVGYLGPNPGWGKARETRLTHDEQRTLLTMWSMFRSPLMIGGELTKMDAWTEGLLTNAEVIAVDQASMENRTVEAGEGLAAWVAKAADGRGRYVAVVNTTDASREVDLPVAQLGWEEGRYRMRDLWNSKEVSAAAVRRRLGPHACVLYRAERLD